MTGFVLDTYTINVQFNTVKAAKQMKQLKDSAAKGLTGVKTPASIGTSGALGGAVGASIGGAKGLAGLGLGAAVVSGLKDGVELSIEFEKGLVGIEKTTGITGDTLKGLGKDISQITQDVRGTAVPGLLEYAQAAGTMGVKGREDILAFTKTLAQLELASDLSGEGSAQSLAKILTVTGTANSQISNLGSAIVFAGNNFATTESRVANTTKRVAQAGASFDITAAQAVGIATAMDAVGVESEVAGSSVQKVLSAMEEDTESFSNQLGITGQELKRNLQTDAAGVFSEFIKNLSKVKEEGGSINETLRDLDLKDIRVVSSLSTLASNFDVLEMAVEGTSSAYAENIALQQEASTAGGSTAAKVQALGQAFDNLKRNATGSELVGEIAVVTTNLINTLQTVPPEFFKILGAAAIGFGGVKLLGKGFVNLSGKIGKPTFKLKGLLNIFRLNPWGIAITGLLALISNWDLVTGAITKAKDAVSSFFSSNPSEIAFNEPSEQTFARNRARVTSPADAISQSTIANSANAATQNTTVNQTNNFNGVGNAQEIRNGVTDATSDALNSTQIAGSN